MAAWVHCCCATFKVSPLAGQRTNHWLTAISFLFVNGIAFAIPALAARRGVPLADAFLLASMPSLGMVMTLVVWGYVIDHVGERIVLTVGSALTAVATYAAA